jgi:hypothetical protein
VLWPTKENFGLLPKKFTKSLGKTLLLVFVLRTLPSKFTATIPDSEHAKCGGVCITTPFSTFCTNFITGARVSHRYTEF